MHCDATPFHVGTAGTGASDAGGVTDASTPDGGTGGGAVDAGKEQ